MKTIKPLHLYKCRFRGRKAEAEESRSRIAYVFAETELAAHAHLCDKFPWVEGFSAEVVAHGQNAD